jgi:RimJ/RimL family protein N-acetyltransferase
MEPITIEELQVKDLSLVAKWLSAGQINRWLTAEWRNRVISTTLLAIALRNRRNRFFLVRCNGEACGLTALADIDVVDSTAMIWYVLGEPRFTRKGITSKAVRQLVQKSFQELKLRSLYAWVMADNAVSAKVLTAVGFREAGRIRQAVASNGHQVDRIYFDLVPSDCPEFDFSQ